MDNNLPNNYFGIGVYNCKTNYNLGVLWRSAYCFGASYVFLIGKRFEKECSDTVKCHRKIPVFEYKDFDDFKKHLPYSSQLVGVEISDNSEDICKFVHPPLCNYLLGAEDNGLPPKILEQCHRVVKLNTKTCLNVSVTGSIILYDRHFKEVVKS